MLVRQKLKLNLHFQLEPQNSEDHRIKYVDFTRNIIESTKRLPWTAQVEPSARSWFRQFWTVESSLWSRSLIHAWENGGVGRVGAERVVAPRSGPQENPCTQHSSRALIGCFQGGPNAVLFPHGGRFGYFRRDRKVSFPLWDGERTNLQESGGLTNVALSSVQSMIPMLIIIIVGGRIINTRFFLAI